MNDEWIDTQAGYVWPVWCGRDHVFKVSERERQILCGYSSFSLEKANFYAEDLKTHLCIANFLTNCVQN